jgi:hypothetical protein
VPFSRRDGTHEHTRAPERADAKVETSLVSPVERRRYIRTVVILAIAALLLVWLWIRTGGGDFTFLVQARSADNEEIAVSTGAKGLVLACVLVALTGLALFALRLVRSGPLFVLLVLLVGLAFVVGFCAWAYAPGGRAGAADDQPRCRAPSDTPPRWSSARSPGHCASARESSTSRSRPSSSPVPSSPPWPRRWPTTRGRACSAACSQVWPWPRCSPCSRSATS